MHHDGEPVMQYFRQLGVREKPLQQQDALAVAGIAQPDGVVEFQQREPLRIRQRARHPQQSVSVGVGFDDSHHCRLTGVPARNGKIVFQGGKVETSLNRASHVRFVFPTLRIGSGARSLFYAFGGKIRQAE